jgi:uncharacterized protein
MTGILLVALFLLAVLAGAAASVVGFGIGSLITPVVATRLGMETAIAVVALPHAVATAVRAWRLRSHIDWHVLMRFGLLSAVGGLAGAAAYASVTDRTLTVVLGGLLLLTATAGLGGWSDRWRPQGRLVWLVGLASGLFGGMAGNQGGLRAAALAAFPLAPAAFVATSTAVGVLVDLARTPVYLVRAGDRVLSEALLVGVLTVGVLAGTVLGERVLLRLPHPRFRRILAVTIGLLGVWLLLGALA